LVVSASRQESKADRGSNPVRDPVAARRHPDPGSNEDPAVTLLAVRAEPSELDASKYAPTWLSQLPGILRSDRLEELQRRAAGATRARTVRHLHRRIAERMRTGT